MAAAVSADPNASAPTMKNDVRDNARRNQKTADGGRKARNVALSAHLVIDAPLMQMPRDHPARPGSAMPPCRFVVISSTGAMRFVRA